MTETPITDEWLAEVDFKWRQGDRQPNKHWKLILNVPHDDWLNCIEPTSIELQRSGWENDKGDYIGDPHSWMLWITDRFDRNAFIRTIHWQEEVTALAALISGRPWNPATHIYGQAWPDGSHVLDRMER